MASECAKRIALPANPALTRGGSKSTPATWPTRSDTVSEVAKPCWASSFVYVTTAHDRIMVPAGVP